MNYAQEIIDYINRISAKNYFWHKYASCKSERVRQTINDLREFANRKPGIVADNCNAEANRLETELDAALAKFDLKDVLG